MKVQVKVKVLPQEFFYFFSRDGFATFPDLKEIALTLGPFGFTDFWAGSWFNP